MKRNDNPNSILLACRTYKYIPVVAGLGKGKPKGKEQQLQAYE